MDKCEICKAPLMTMGIQIPLRGMEKTVIICEYCEKHINYNIELVKLYKPDEYREYMRGKLWTE